MRMLGPSMSCLLKMYDFMIFSLSIQVNLSYTHSFIYLPLMPHDDKLILFIYLPNVFEKIQQIKCMKSKF